jgi:hypothetical protein
VQVPPQQDWPEEQDFPHIPQFCISVFVFVQTPPHGFCPPGQFCTHCPLWQTCPDGQTMPQGTSVRNIHGQIKAMAIAVRHLGMMIGTTIMFDLQTPPEHTCSTPQRTLQYPQ